jgi:hypothetical protein
VCVPWSKEVVLSGAIVLLTDDLQGRRHGCHGRCWDRVGV